MPLVFAIVGILLDWLLIIGPPVIGALMVLAIVSVVLTRDRRS